MTKSNGITVEHGADEVHGARIDSYNLEIRKGEDWIGDQASRLAFWTICDDIRKQARVIGFDPFKKPTTDVSKKEFDQLLRSKDVRLQTFANSVIEQFAQQLVEVVIRFLAVKKWQKTELIVFGGGLMASRAGEMIIERAAFQLAAKDIKVALRRTTADPDTAGLTGAAELFPPWMLKGYDGMLAVDIGGTNIRAAILKLKKADHGFLDVRVLKKIVWKHDKSSKSREAAVNKLIRSLAKLIKDAGSSEMHLAPVVGIACPGIIERDGSIRRGDQNLPGDWTSDSFNLSAAITKKIPKLDGHDLHVVVHNDAVVQGLSEKSQLENIKNWAVLTIGTGLGNAKFSRTE